MASITYDRDGDVLYVRFSRKRSVKGIEDAKGRVWRYDDWGDLVGVTIIDFADRLIEERALAP